MDWFGPHDDEGDDDVDHVIDVDWLAMISIHCAWASALSASSLVGGRTARRTEDTTTYTGSLNRRKSHRFLIWSAFGIVVFKIAHSLITRPSINESRSWLRKYTSFYKQWYGSWWVPMLYYWWVLAENKGSPGCSWRRGHGFVILDDADVDDGVRRCVDVVGVVVVVVDVVQWRWQ